MKYLHLNVIKDYNQHMNSMDIAGQLRGNYWPDQWIRHRKWWWAFFIWGISVARVNAYKIYKGIYDEEAAKGMPNLPPRWTHARFLEELVYDFVFPGQLHRKPVDTASTSSSTHNSSICSFSVLHKGVNEERVYDLQSSQGWKDYLREVKTKRIMKTTLEGGVFKHHLNGMRHNSIQAKKNDHCQYCYFQYMNEVLESKREHYPELRQNQSSVRKCLQCNVNLCPQCDNIFHGADLSTYSSVSMD